MSDDDEIYNTEFGPIDGGTRRIAGYLIMALFTIIGLGASYQMLTTPPAPLVDESFYVVAAAIVLLLFIGMPLAIMGTSIFKSGNRKRKSADRTYARRRRNNSSESTIAAKDDSETYGLNTENVPKDSRHEKASDDLAFKNEWPKEKKDGDLK